MRNSPVTRTEFGLIAQVIEELQRQVRQLQNVHAPTVPVYLPDTPDDQIDGQIALVPADQMLEQASTDVKPAWSRGGDWRPFAPGMVGAAVRMGVSLAPETIPSGSQFSTETHIDFADTIWDSGGFLDLLTDPDLITAAEDGLYFATANVAWDTAPTDATIRHMAIFQSAGSGTSPHDTRENIPSQGLRQSVACWLTLSAGDYVWLGVTQESGSNRDATGASLSLVRLGDKPF